MMFKLIPHALIAVTASFSVVAYSQQKPTVNCVNYYEKGTSSCRNLAPSAFANPFSPTIQLAPQPVLNTPQSPPKLLTPTDKFLANYGKPPEEFVEFYLNPTPENARRWATTYQQMQQKSRDIAVAWASAEQSLVNLDAEPAQQAPRSNSAPLEVVIPELIQEKTMISPPNISLSTPANTQRIFPRISTINERLGSISLTYYFSANCPFCVRQEPELQSIIKKTKSKLVFTCVDMTPLSATYKPDPANIRGLPCTWRTATDAEIAQQGIRQTPTFKVERPGQSPEILAGYQNPAVLEGLLR